MGAAEVVSQEMQRSGLPVHETEVSIGGQTLGWEIAEASHEIGATPQSIWRMRFALEEVLKTGSLRGDELEVLLGHYTVRALIRRELLSVMAASYRFAREMRGRRAVLWPAVQRELRWAKGLCMMAFRDLSAPWHPEVLAVDASWWGGGAVSARFDCRGARAWKAQRALALLAGRRRAAGASHLVARSRDPGGSRSTLGSRVPRSTPSEFRPCRVMSGIVSGPGWARTGGVAESRRPSSRGGHSCGPSSTSFVPCTPLELDTSFWGTPWAQPWLARRGARPLRACCASPVRSGPCCSPLAPTCTCASCRLRPTRATTRLGGARGTEPT